MWLISLKNIFSRISLSGIFGVTRGGAGHVVTYVALARIDQESGGHKRSLLVQAHLKMPHAITDCGYALCWKVASPGGRDNWLLRCTERHIEIGP